MRGIAGRSGRAKPAPGAVAGRGFRRIRPRGRRSPPAGSPRGRRRALPSRGRERDRRPEADERRSVAERPLLDGGARPAPGGVDVSGSGDGSDAGAGGASGAGRSGAGGSPPADGGSGVVDWPRAGSVFTTSSTGRTPLWIALAGSVPSTRTIATTTPPWPNLPILAVSAPRAPAFSRRQAR